MTTPRLHGPCGVWLAAIAVAVAAAASAAAQAPVAPAPETLVDAGAVVPASLAEEVSAEPQAGAVRLGPVPLAAGPAAGSSRSPSSRDLGNWAVLAALAAAFAMLAAVRFHTRRRPVALPPDVFELLGEASLGGQQTVRVVRFGPRTLLVGVSAAGCHTLAEIDDPQATDCIVAACRGMPARGRSPVSTAVASPGRPRAAGRGAAGVVA
jgi:flagellar biogenesis protein FliO